MKDLLTRYARSAYTVFKQLKLKGLITAFSSGAEFSQLIKPLGSRPLILSGHPGDEVMAMGGTMAWYGKLKAPVAVVTFTAGRRGTNTGRMSKSLGPKRRKEQIAAFGVLPVEVHPTYWDLDERFPVTEDLIFQLLETVDEINPDIIYVPSLLDIHPDSQALNRALVSVIERLPSPRLKNLQIAQYELWTPIVPNKILSLDGYEETKQKAIECHESQLLCRNYLDAMLGLNRYRAAMLGAGNYAEAFFVCSAKQYVEFLNIRPAPVIEMLP
ncbi:MAG TPA: PIG-L family deacetylase [Patescibacteria group bacterium]